MNDTNEERSSLLTIQKVAKSLGVCRRTLEREISRGNFPRPLKVGTASRWPESDLQAYLDRLHQQRAQAHPSS